MSRIGIRSALLAAFLIASGAPLLVFWLWPHSKALRDEVEQVEMRHLLLARNLGAALQRYHRDVTLVFRSLAPLIATGADVEFARQMLIDLDFRHVCVADRATGEIVSSFLTEQSPCPPIVPEDRMAMFHVMTTEGAAPMSPVKTPGGGEPRLFLAARVDEVIVIGAISTAYFRQLAERISFGSSGHAVIVDDMGSVLAHPDENWRRMAKSMLEFDAVRRMLNGESGVARFQSPVFDAPMIAGFTAVPEAGWGVMVPQSLDELRMETDRLNRSAMVVFAAGLILSACIALTFSSLVSRHVGVVADAARRMAQGDDGVRVDAEALGWSLREFVVLGRAFNTMARRTEAAHDRVARLARHDSLTGLPNRAAFFDLAERTLEDAGADARFSLFFIDVDRFKSINDSYGHQIGDAVLREVGERLRSAAQEHLVARHAGDEFVLLRRCADPEECLLFASTLLDRLGGAITLNDRRVVATVSIGVACWPDDATDLDELLAHADQAMYRAKQEGRNALRLFDAGLKARYEENATLQRELQEALDARRVATVFQPVFRASDGSLCGYEALARWTSPSFGVVSPERFVSIAEESGLIAELGREVRRQAAAFAVALAERGVTAQVAVNVSQIELARPDFATEIALMLDGYGLDMDALILEITEIAAAEQVSLGLETLEKLAGMGVSLALDDFGKGFAPHSRLRAFPVNRLKIDLAVAGDIAHDPQALSVVESLVRLGKSLDMIVTVEGVETEAQDALLVEIGADELQGFLHSPPLERADAAAFAAKPRRGAGRVSRV